MGTHCLTWFSCVCDLYAAHADIDTIKSSSTTVICNSSSSSPEPAKQNCSTHRHEAPIWVPQACTHGLEVDIRVQYIWRGGPMVIVAYPGGICICFCCGADEDCCTQCTRQYSNQTALLVRSCLGALHNNRQKLACTRATSARAHYLTRLPTPALGQCITDTPSHMYEAAKALCLVLSNLRAYRWPAPCCCRTALHHVLACLLGYALPPPCY